MRNYPRLSATLFKTQEKMPSSFFIIVTLKQKEIWPEWMVDQC